MAIDPSAKSISSYKKHYKMLVLTTLVGSQIIMSAGAGLVMFATRLLSWHDPTFWMIILVILLLGLGTVVIAIPIVTEPLYNLLSALIHKVGEPTTTTPPNPNAKRFEKTGFKTALEAIYESQDYDNEDDLAASSKQEHILMQALNHTSCGVVVLDPQKKVISANKAAPIYQTPEGDTYIALDFLDDQNLMDWLAEIDDKTVSAERTWRRVPIDSRVAHATRLFDVVASYQKGAPGETVILLFDQSEQYLPEEEDLNFIAFAAHELRGPITIIRGYLDVLGDELAPRLVDDEPQLMDRLTVSANRLSGYIDNILNVARFDRHHLEVHLAEENLINIYASIADDMQMRASTQHRLLNISIPDNLPTVAADKNSIGEVIGNLIDNAIKYSFEGGVVNVTAEQKGDFVEVSVSDNGIGMPANVLKNLFHKFYRSHRSRESVAGTGIGLYICKAFVESHGGIITARSQENEGSTFSFTLPIYATVKDKLLEDGQLNRQLIRQGSGWIKNHSMYRGG